MSVYETQKNDFYNSYTAVMGTVGGPGTQNTARNEDLIPYFGIPNNPEQLKGDNAFVTRRQLPFAYKDKNILISTRIEGLVIKNPEELLSAEYGAPPTKTDSLKFSVVSYYFDEGMLDVEPEEGVARHMRFAQRKASGTLIRKSKGMHFEHGFLYTDEGKRLYQLQQVQLANTVVNDMIYHTLYALRESRHQSIEFEVRDGIHPRDFIEAVLKKNKEFACFQKYEDGPSNLINKVQNELQLRAGVTANAIVCSRGLEYFWSGKAAEIKANEKTGSAISESSPYGVTSKSNLKLIFTRLFQNQEVGQLPIDPLIRERVNGEYYVMAPPPLEQVRGSGLENYRSSHRNIKIMDFEGRKWGTITLKDAINASPIWESAETGALLTPDKDEHHMLFSKDGETTINNFSEMGDRFLPTSFFLAMMEQKGFEPAAKSSSSMSLLGKRSSRSYSSSKLYPVYEKPKSAIKTSTETSFEDLHAKNKNSLAQNIITAPVSTLYDAAMSSNGVKPDKFSAKVDHVLETGDTTALDTLKTHLTLLTDPETASKKRIESLKYFNESVPEKRSLIVEEPISQSKSSTQIQFLNEAEYLDDPSKYDLASVDSDHPDGSYDVRNINDVKSLLSMKQSVKSGMELKDLKKTERAEFNASFDKWAALVDYFGSDNVEKFKEELGDFGLSKQKLIQMVDRNILFPLAFLIFRPWMTWITSTIILLRGGSNTIVNFYMQPDVMLQDDATTKTHSAHVTMHLAPFVKAPGNIKVVDDVAVRRYVSGGNVTPIKQDELDDFAKIRGWTLGDNDLSGSYFALPIAITEVCKLPSVIDFRGYFFNTNRDRVHPHFITATTSFAKASFAHPDPIHPESPPAPETALDPMFNSICTQGTQLCYNYNTNTYTAIIRGQDSPWSGMVYPEMTTVIEGMQKLLTPPDYGDISKYPPYEFYHE